jgi:hypothetical protein
MRKLLTRLLLAACCTSVPLAVFAGVTGTHGPDRMSGAAVAKPKPAPADEQSGDQTAKPSEEKEKKDVDGKDK